MEINKTYKNGKYDVIAFGATPKKENEIEGKFIVFHLQLTVEEGGLKIEDVISLIKKHQEMNNWVSAKNTMIIIKPISVDKDCPYEEVDEMEQGMFDFLLEAIKKWDAEKKGKTYIGDKEIPEVWLIRGLVSEVGPENTFPLMELAYLLYRELKEGRGKSSVNKDKKLDEKVWN